MKRHQTILVVDDDRETRTMIGRILRVEGYEVAQAANGKSALAQLERHRPDMVILDIMMSKMDGFQVLDLIRQRSSVPVIMLTGICEVTTLRDAIVHGADDYIYKPFHTRELVARIRAKLRRAESKAAPLAALPITG